MASALLVAGLWSGAPSAVVVGCFGCFAFANALTGNLTAVYPIEVFPTSARSSGVGLASAASRVGAAIGTFLLPTGIATLGIGGSLLVAAALCVLGALVSHRYAPETTGQTLTRTGSPVGGS